MYFGVQLSIYIKNVGCLCEIGITRFVMIYVYIICVICNSILWCYKLVTKVVPCRPWHCPKQARFAIKGVYNGYCDNPAQKGPSQSVSHKHAALLFTCIDCIFTCIDCKLCDASEVIYLCWRPELSINTPNLLRLLANGPTWQSLPPTYQSWSMRWTLISKESETRRVLISYLRCHFC